MDKTRVLWLSNISLLIDDTAGSGSWLRPLAQRLEESQQVILCNITQGDIKSTKQKTSGQIHEWLIPHVRQSHCRHGHLPDSFVKEVTDIIENFVPDVIHVWGTENVWGLFTARIVTNHPVLLELQGLKRAIARIYAGGLSIKEQLACIGLKEILRRNTIFHARKKFADWGRFEEEIILGHTHILAESTWQQANIQAINSSCQIFRRHLILRSAFYEASPWQYPENKTIFCSASYPSAFKGLHVAIRALALLKPLYPTIQLRIAGAIQQSGIRQEGYVAWLNREAEKLGVASNIVWLGGLRASHLAREMNSACCLVLPTFIESYSMVTAEAAYVGIPVVAAYVGAIPTFVRDEESALFFSPGDTEMCAYQLARLLSDTTLAERISSQARNVALDYCNPNQIVRDQIKIYHQLIDENNLN